MQEGHKRELFGRNLAMLSRPTVSVGNGDGLSRIPARGRPLSWSAARGHGNGSNHIARHRLGRRLRTRGFTPMKTTLIGLDRAGATVEENPADRTGVPIDLRESNRPCTSSSRTVKEVCPAENDHSTDARVSCLQ
jgi:hypothetical protein